MKGRRKGEEGRERGKERDKEVGKVDKSQREIFRFTIQINHNG